MSDNYWNDHRVRAMNTRGPFESFNEKTMMAVFLDDDEEPHDVPCVYEVCGCCNGRGSVVNPSIDCNGITASEWDEWDDDERKGYMSGAFDIACPECHGNRVVPVVDRKRAPELAKLVDRRESDEASYYAEVAAERRMGC